jgi:hypothetical protein
LFAGTADSGKKEATHPAGEDGFACILITDLINARHSLAPKQGKPSARRKKQGFMNSFSCLTGN